MRSGRLLAVLVTLCFAPNCMFSQMLRTDSKSHRPRYANNRPVLPALKLHVVVSDFAHLQGSVLLQAEAVASEIFRETGVQVDWLNCFPATRCDEPEEFPLFRLAIHARISEVVTDDSVAKQLTDQQTLGLAIPCEAIDSYCLLFAFYSPIRSLSAQREIYVDSILGHVMAHEIGHALLGPHAHSRRGVMQGKLPIADLERYLSFTSGQSKLIRIALLARDSILKSRSNPLPGKSFNEAFIPLSREN